MSTRFPIAALIYGMVGTVLSGAGTLLVLSIPALAAEAMWLLPAIGGGSVLLSAPVAWWMAPRLWLRSRHDCRARYADERCAWIRPDAARRGA